MDNETQRRIGENEAKFRDVNEMLEQGLWPEEKRHAAFRCECARLGCNEMIDVEISVYEQVRENPRRFLVARGHELSGAEVIVETAAGYAIVEKIGEAAMVAELTDPRS